MSPNMQTNKSDFSLKCFNLAQDCKLTVAEGIQKHPNFLKLKTFLSKKWSYTTYKCQLLQFDCRNAWGLKKAGDRC